MSHIVFDEPAWWQRTRWRVAAAVALTFVAVIVWWAALTPPAPAPPAASPSYAAVRMAPQPAQPMEPTQRITPPAQPAITASSPPAASPTQPLSTMIAPGVHVTPLSVPPGTVPQPAGPSERDSESEN
jgi:hypothetical protein